ncbi:hypothetical protein MHM87_05615 [Alteromonas sp. Cnat3-28]|uniref:hypothetical protein n=1 Tax=Alteromonas sp. Cnat3-28 TaxID=2917729 RepID=UPI001EF463A7|nr:hypothetical protein [Alteromonas sp. Cnat3-28]MCG7645066.1 hypothetical protein [Alteromonas sp. Cnat3-28]
MMLTEDWMVFIVGSLGGSANEILHWYSLRTNPNVPHYATSLFYWFITAGMICLGGLLAWLQLGPGSSALVTFQIGLAAPLILEKMAKTLPRQKGGMGVLEPSIRDFLGW